jgi:hypothetical protein
LARGAQELWEKRAPPTPLLLEQLLPLPEALLPGGQLQRALEAARAGAGASASASRLLGLSNASQVGPGGAAAC